MMARDYLLSVTEVTVGNFPSFAISLIFRGRKTVIAPKSIILKVTDPRCFDR